MPRRRGLRPRPLAAVLRLKATLAFAAERQVVRRTGVQQLFLKTTLSFREVADQLASRVLVGFEVQERDGLNLGGGDYFLFTAGDTKVALVSNDADHAEVFEPSRKDFRFYCYVRRGSRDVLRRMLASLSAVDLVGELVDDA